MCYNASMFKKFKIILYIFLFLGVSGVYWQSKKENNTIDNSLIKESNAQADIQAPEDKKDRVERIEIVDGATYGALMASSGVDNVTAMAIYDSAFKSYDLAKVRLGKFIELTFDKDTNELRELYYKIDTEDQLHIWRTITPGVASSSPEMSAWQSKKEAIPYEIKIITSKGVVKSSMYQAALDNNIDERAIMALADVFQWTIDFAMDPRVDDIFSFVWEQRFLNGEYVMPGRVLAGKYVNSGKEYAMYYSGENNGYFDQDGNSVQRMFLRAPVEFRYISSGFTTGRRYVEAFNVSTGHRAIDYAASMGTPIRAVGNGTVTKAGWGGPYGNLTSIRHNGTYSTNYGHQSRIIVKVGQRVKQGEIIGYVGSTGFSTGPHLHYEMVKNGVKINPYNETMPQEQVTKVSNKDSFMQEVEKLKELIK
ncbi:M23 family metallopeptidase [Patescibacteria group bacterium]|nr:M23 family metallopeptidase [Patescibacteria group bacterium]MBU4309841.1 M23 family metallopeptidase [Patescibacteria group bacterium]MBU4431986.1 M23 family metallopeptidase [Patescibacteria group bacterium]MBU4578180.1 M23 family metallopeptidase [Patescibacteria group bacterium]